MRYAHVNVWRLNDEGAAWSDDTARAIGARLQAQPGFRSYTVIRTGEWELVVVTVFDSQAQLEAAVGGVAPLVRERVRPLTDGVADRRAGGILFHLAA
jgi:hypothetical protein